MSVSLQSAAAFAPCGAAAASNPTASPHAGWQRDLPPNAAPASGAPSSSLDAGAACLIDDCPEARIEHHFCSWHARDYARFRDALFGAQS